MKISKWFGIALLTVAALVISAVPGCSNGTGNIAVQDFSKKVRESLPNLHTYASDMKLEMDASGKVEDQSVDAQFVLNENGAVDIPAKKTGLEMNLAMTGHEGSDPISQTTRVLHYTQDGVTYVGSATDNADITWNYQPESVTAWTDDLQTEQLMILLENSEVKTLKAETLDGERCFLVEVAPNMSILWDTIMTQMGSSGGDENYNDEMTTATKSTTVQFWVTQNTLFIKKVYLRAKVSLDATMLGAQSGNMDYTFDITINLANHNQDVTITVPPDALAKYAEGTGQS